MSKTKSLQYLLLDTLNKRNFGKNKVEVNSLAKSLRVSENNMFYEITWIEKFKKKKIEVSKDKFSFYVRNDILNNSKPSENALEKNNKSSSEIIDKILKQKVIKRNSQDFFKKYIFQVLCIILFFSPIIFVSSIENKIIGIGILLIMFLDIIEKKKIISHSLFLIITLYKPNILILFYSSFLLFFTIFEPGIKFKKIKTILLTIIISLNLYFIENFVFLINIHLPIILVLILMLTINNFIKYNSNFNWIYCIPSFSLIFYSYQNILLSYIALLISSFIPYWFNLLDKRFFLKKD